MTTTNQSIILPSLLATILLLFMAPKTTALVPYTRPMWELEDPFRILEQTPLSIPNKGLDSINQALMARVDWKETSKEHVITLDIPGLKKEDVKVEIEENRVLRISGERKSEEEVDGERWHRVERTSGKFWRQFRLPNNADFDRINAYLENGVLKITVPKLAEEKRQPKVINVVGSDGSGQDIKTTTKADM